MPELDMSAIQALAPAPTSNLLPSAAASSTALTALYTAALGHGPQERYLRRFAQFDASGRTSPGWNGAASFCTLSWAILRQLWVPALLYVAVLEGLSLLAWGTGRWFLPAQASVPWPLLAVAALAWLLPGMYGDALLHTEIRKRIVMALTQTQSVAEACALLGQRASSQRRLKKLVFANAAVALTAATACYFWLPPGAVFAPLAPNHPAEPELTAAQALALTPNTVARLTAEPKPVPAIESVPTPAPVPARAMPAPSLRGETFTPPADKPSNPSPSNPLHVPAKPVVAPPIAATPARTLSTTPSTASTPPTRTPTLGTQPGYYLNVGLFAEEANARKVQARLLNANLPAFRQHLETTQGHRIRVRVGPFRTRQETTVAQATLRGMALEAVVLRR